MTYYPVPNVTGIVEYLQWTNQVTGYWFGPLVVLAWTVIVLLALKNYPTEKAFASATFNGLILCIGFYALGICEVQHVLISGVALLISILAMRSSSY